MQAFTVATLPFYSPSTFSKTLDKPHASSSTTAAASPPRSSAVYATSLSRKRTIFWPVKISPEITCIQDYKLQKWCIREVSRKSVSVSDTEDLSVGENVAKKKNSRSSKKPSTRRRKKATAEISEMLLDSNVKEEDNLKALSDEDSNKVTRKGRRKASGTNSGEGNIEKKVGRRSARKTTVIAGVDIENSSQVICSDKQPQSMSIPEVEKELLLGVDDTEDVSFTYEWPPLVCCYGAAQHAFIPSGRPSNRLIDHEIHETMNDMFWSPMKFVRAPGGSSSGVAVALASLGGRVAFMGKLGDDEYGQSMLYHLNDNKVQTRSVKINSSKPTAISHMKISRRGGLRATCTRPSAEDSLLSSDINIDVLKEAKMFYFNSYALLDPNMKTTMQAIQISKKFGGVIFFDLNLPFPLWRSREETITLIQQAWSYADIIEVTKQELEFLCGIEPTENFDTKDNDKLKFVHYKPDIVMPLWHENLKVLFVTNGTSKIHYYTENDNGWVHGMEDAPITPFTAEMSVSGDAIVAALMRMLTVQPHLVTDKGYLEHMIKYAIDCGVIDQWLASRIRGFPTGEGMDGVRSISEREYRTEGPESD